MKRNPVHSQQARNKVRKALLRGTTKKNKNLREKDGGMIKQKYALVCMLLRLVS